MFRRITHTGAVLGAALLVIGLAYLQGYSDRDQGVPMGLIASAFAAERPSISPTQKLDDPTVYYP